MKQNHKFKKSMNKPIPLEHGKFYHIYNRGIDSCKIFKENTNYEHFLRLYERYISLVADTYAWCLMGNHFHLLLRIKNEEEIGFIPLKNELLSEHKSNEIAINAVTPSSAISSLDGGFEKKKYKPSNQLSHLFNAYTNAFNKKYERTGALFEKPFRRINIDSIKYLNYLIYYIHHNPVHHGFVDDMIEYPWSSYLTILSPNKTHLKRKEVIEWFDDTGNYKYFHNQQHDLDNVKELLIDG